MPKTPQIKQEGGDEDNEDDLTNPDHCTVTLTDSGGESVEIVLTCPLNHILKIIDLISKIGLSCTRIVSQKVKTRDFYDYDDEPLKDK